MIQNMIDYFVSVSLESSILEDRVEYITEVDYAPVNGVIDLGTNSVQEVVNSFKKRGLPFIWWGDQPKLSETGMQFGGVMRGVALQRPERISTSPLPNGLTIDRVERVEEISLFCEVLLESFAFGPSLISSYTRSIEVAFERGSQAFWIGRVNSEPAAVVSLVTAPTSSGIWNLGTLPQFRCKGISTAMIVEAVQLAADEGHKEVMSLLMPKGMAWGLMQRLGFEEISSHPFYIGGASSQELEPSSS